MEDVSQEFFDACSGLELGQIVALDEFQLGEAMSAIELMDQKMDIGMIRFTKKMGLDVCIEQGLYKASYAEQLTTLDATMCLFVSWLEGASISQTLWTNVMLPNVSEIEHDVYGAMANAYAHLTIIIRACIQNACCYEEEDFNPILPYRIDPPHTREQTLKILRGTIARLAHGSQSLHNAHVNSRIFLALGARLELLCLLIEVLTCLTPPPRTVTKKYQELDEEDDEEEIPPSFQPNFRQAVDVSKRMMAVSQAIAETAMLGLLPPDFDVGDGDFSWLIAIEPDLNRKYMPSTFPRRTEIPPRKDGLRYMVSLAKRIYTIASEAPDSVNDLTSLFYFARILNLNGSCVLSRAILQLAVFPIDEHIFGDQSMTVGDAIENTLKEKYAPLVLIRGNPVYEDHVCQALYNMFLNGMSKIALNVYQILGCNFARQRERLVQAIEDLGNLQMEAGRVEARTEETVSLRRDKDQQLIAHPSVATFVFNNLIALITYYFELSFRLDLFAPYEFGYIYWYISDVLCRWQITTMERSQEMMLQSWGLNPLSRSTNPRKKLQRDKAEDLLKKKVNLNQWQMILQYGLANLAEGVQRTTMALVKMKKIKVPMWCANTERLRYENRFGPFASLGHPLANSYNTFKELSKIDAISQREPAEIMELAVEFFDLARKNLERLCEKPEMRDDASPYLKVARANFVAARLLVQQDMSQRNIEWKFSAECPSYPLLKIF